jgi:hypothetical protein
MPSFANFPTATIAPAHGWGITTRGWTRVILGALADGALAPAGHPKTAPYLSAFLRASGLFRSTLLDLQKCEAKDFNDALREVLNALLDLMEIPSDSVRGDAAAVLKLLDEEKEMSIFHLSLPKIDVPDL